MSERQLEKNLVLLIKQIACVDGSVSMAKEFDHAQGMIGCHPPEHTMVTILLGAVEGLGPRLMWMLMALTNEDLLNICRASNNGRGSFPQ